MAMFGHRWQKNRAGLTLLDHLLRAVTALDSSTRQTGEYRAHLERARDHLGKGVVAESAAHLDAFRERIRSDLADGALPPEEGERLLLLADQLAALLD